jgi:hypothetical protein
MPDILDPLNEVLDKHAAAILELEARLLDLSGKSVDPMRLQGIADRVASHTVRLTNLLQGLPK